MNQDTVDLRGLTAVLRRRWRLVSFFAVVCTLLAVGLALTESPTYKSTASLEVAPLNGQPSANGIVMQPAEITTQMAVIASTPVALRVIDQLKLDETPGQLLSTVSVAQEGDTRVIDVSAQRASATSAAEVPNAFAEQYLSYRYERGTEEAQREQKALQEQADNLRSQYDSVSRQIAKAPAAEVPALQGRQQALLVQLTQVLNAQAAVSAGAPSPGSGGQVLIPATSPKGAASPKPVRSAALGLIVGLMLGFAAAFIRDYFDDGIRDEQRLRDLIAPKSVLGKIPLMPQSSHGRVVSLLEPASPSAEAFRALSTNVRFLLAAQRGHSSGDGAAPSAGGYPRPNKASGQVLLVTSAMASEGKTDVSANLAVALSRYGLRVVIVDADLRLPQLARRFGLGQPPGVTDFLAGDEPLESYLIDVGGVKILPGGNLAPNPAELLASSEMDVLVSSLTKRFDVVLIDSTPVLRVADTLELMRLSDATMVVCRYGVSRARNVNDCMERIRQVGGTVSGAVLVSMPTAGDTDPYGAKYYEAAATLLEGSEALKSEAPSAAR